MRDGQSSTTVRRADYRPADFLVDSITLDIDIIDDQRTRVSSCLELRRHPQSRATVCQLHGEGLQIESILLDGAPLPASRYAYQHGVLTIDDMPESTELQTVVMIDPASNTALEGLYVSNGMYCTQCEAEGFRRITFFPDRPDVLARFTTTIRADRQRFPLLLSNGNPLAQGSEGERHWITWQDPFPKPCYLFALVAGDLACLEDQFITCSGRQVALRIYAEHRDLDKLDHAMDSLKRAMRWDEKTYGREYDLDLYMIVAVSHFNMGAMENKGLNIFNTACVLAHPETTTDLGFQRVESVVAHEYFHNWSGNRVTCRDWFQLSLKEGFTVFRDQEFSADMHSRAVQRIENVEMLRTMQFAEDGGPMAHPVRPDEYQKIDNFYTVTIYEKGAELVRMQHQLLGAEKFRQATDLYFDRYDGQAVTCDDFVDCMAEVSNLDLAQFRRWYGQAGTPQLQISEQWQDGHYQLHCRQHTPATPGQPDKQPLMIPLALALLDQQGNKLPLDAEGAMETVAIITETKQTLSFDLAERPVPSLLRGFSAPVALHFDYQPEQLAHLLACDDDGFCRFDAGQRLALAALTRVMAGADVDTEAAALAGPWQQVLAGAEADPAGSALLLALPSEKVIGEQMTELQPAAVHAARRALQAALGRQLAEQCQRLLPKLRVTGSYRAKGDDIGRRALAQQLLTLLVAASAPGIDQELAQRYHSATNMTERLGALRLAVWFALPPAPGLLADFAERYADEALVMDQWFAVQAQVPGPATVAQARTLLDHAAFDWRSPNRVRALLGSLANGNPSAFHASDGSGYQLFVEALQQLDPLNPQVAARMANAAAVLPRLSPALAALLRTALTPLQGADCSVNLREVVGRITG